MTWQPDYITLAEAKTFMDDTTTVHDADIAVAITATSRAIDGHCNRQFGKVAAAVERLYTPWFDGRRRRWIIEIDDLMTTTNLVLSIDGDATIEFRKEPVNAAADGMPWTQLSIDPATASVVPTGAEFEAAVVAIWGWTTVPVSVTEAARLQLNRLVSRRQSPYGVAGSPDLGSELRLLAKLDPDVVIVLDKAGLVRPRSVG